MYLHNSTIALLIAVAFPLASFAATPQAEWSLIGETDGLKVFEKEVPGSSILAFRGETVVDAPIGKVFFVLDDSGREEDWVDMLVENELLERFNPREKVQYQSFDLPWPISDRDFVYHAKVFVDPKTQGLHFTMASVEHAKAPPTVGVRAVIFESAFVLTPVEGNKTHVMVEINSDPKGIIPNWLVNLIQEDWPTDTLMGIRRQVKKPFVRELPMPGTSTAGGEEVVAEVPKAEESPKAEEAPAGE